tara:strand:+ start:35 stop:340 length:306 start_codon:yes stop_codon:yes gene_type:complete
MIITQKAEEKIKELLNKEEYLRVKISGGGCSGYRIGLEKETNREADDVLMMDKILFDPISEGFLTEATLDWKNDTFTPTFHWNIPNTKSCGCGNSFQLEDT